MRDDSNFLCLAAFELSESLRRQSIEFAGCDIAIQLAVPKLPVVLGEPRAECSQLCWCQLFNFSFQLFYLCHSGLKFNRGRTILHPLCRLAVYRTTHASPER